MNDDERTALAFGEPREVEILEPEILEPAVEIIEAPPLHLVLAKRPFSSNTERLDVAAGLTISELLRLANIPEWARPRVYVAGDLIYPEFYHVYRPKPGRHVFVQIVPMGGGRGQGKNIGMLIGGILLIIIGAILLYFPATAAAGWPLISLGAGLVLNSVNNLLIPASTPLLAGGAA